MVAIKTKKVIDENIILVEYDLGNGTKQEWYLPKELAALIP